MQEVASVLLEFGADVHARDKSWQTPAHVASTHGSIECMNVLLNPPELSPYAVNNKLSIKPAVKANINMGDRTGRTCLHLAAYYGNEEMCQLLIENGANTMQGDKRDRRPLHWAVFRRHQSIVKLLTDKLETDDLNAKDKDGNTALHAAASIPDDPEGTDFWDINVWIKSSELAQQLVDAGADLNVTNKNGNTIFHTACLNGNTEILPTLIELSKESDNVESTESRSLISQTNKNNKTALHFAAIIHETDRQLEKIDEKNCLDIILGERKSLIGVKSSDKMTALHEAAKSGCSRRVNALLEAGANVHAIDRFGRTALHIAAQGGHCSVFTSLLNAGANLKEQDRHGRTPLHLSAKIGSLTSCEILIVKSSSSGQGSIFDYVNAKDNEGLTAMHHCSYEGSGTAEILQYLITAGADVASLDMYGRTPLHYAAASMNLQCVVFLVNQMGNGINSKDKSGCTALHQAAAKDSDGRCLEYLLSHKANPWICDLQGYTALHYAASNGNVHATMTLIEHESEESDINSEVAIPQSYALYLAVAGKHEDVMIILLSKFNDSINIPPRLLVSKKEGVGQSGRRTFNSNEIQMLQEKSSMALGRPLLHVACRIGHGGIVQQLLEKGANVYTRDTTGQRQTALHYAASYGHVTCVKKLLDSTADSRRLVNMKTIVKDSTNKDNVKIYGGKTALIEAATNGHLKVVNLLLRKGAFIDAKDKFGRTALYMAAASGKEECVETLIEENADIRIQDKTGKTALHAAALKGHVGILGQLIDRLRENPGGIKEGGTMISQLWADLEDNDGFTPLQWAAYSGHEGCVEILTLANPEEIVTYFKETNTTFSPAHCAVFKNQIQCLVLLIEHLGKSVVDLHDANKRTPLHIAAMSNSVECCKILIENGCDVNSRDDKMRTPLMLACQFQNLKCIELLLSTGCDLDLVDKIGNMALHYGCEKDGHAANVILDSASFVDTNVSRQNNKGKT